ncbi:MAG: hypothetical protein H0W27_09630 [Actinobacteria bacterium]|nr:hypothetical protein [Actinomycetota bacterium]
MFLHPLPFPGGVMRFLALERQTVVVGAFVALIAAGVVMAWAAIVLLRRESRREEDSD